MIYPEYDQRIKALKIRQYDDVKADIFAGFEDFVGTKAQIDEKEAELMDRASEAYAKCRQEYNDQYSAIVDEFVKALSEAYGTGVTEVDDKVYSIAYERGHSGGFSDVESVYSDIVELAEVALSAGKRIGRTEPAEDRR